MWSNPILIGTQLPGTFCPVKRSKIGPTSMATEIVIDCFFFLCRGINTDTEVI